MGKVYRRDGEGRHGWYFRETLRGPDGKPFRVHKRAKVQSEKGAKREMDAMRHAAALGKFAPSGRLTLGKVVEEWRESWPEDRRKSTREFYRRMSAAWLPYLGKVPVRDLRPSDVARMTDKLGRSYSAPTVNSALTVLASVLKFAVDRGPLIDASRSIASRKSPSTSGP